MYTYFNDCIQTQINSNATRCDSDERIKANLPLHFRKKRKYKCMNKSISNHIFVTISIHFHDAKKKIHSQCKSKQFVLTSKRCGTVTIPWYHECDLFIACFEHHILCVYILQLTAACRCCCCCSFIWCLWRNHVFAPLNQNAK